MTQCILCGSFEVIDSSRPDNLGAPVNTLTTCPHCGALECRKCAVRHEPYCESLTKQKKAQRGQTVLSSKPNRSIGITPPETTPAPLPLASVGVVPFEPTFADLISDLKNSPENDQPRYEKIGEPIAFVNPDDFAFEPTTTMLEGELVQQTDGSVEAVAGVTESNADTTDAIEGEK